VVAFVGFVGGWNHPPLVDPLLAAIAAACIVTFFTFLPSFIFIFVGAPFIESTQNNLKLTAPLTAITAAVVGVIASLAVFFALHVFWPEQAAIDWPASLAAALGFVALFKFKVNIMKLIGVFALLGLLHQYLV
jgi:chromate transporter